MGVAYKKREAPPQNKGEKLAKETPTGHGQTEFGGSKFIIPHTNYHVGSVGLKSFFWCTTGRVLPSEIDRARATPIPSVNDSSLSGLFQRLQCLPLYSILLALGNPSVDYFSLDVEGAEVPILKTIPFAKVRPKPGLPGCARSTESKLATVGYIN